MKQNFLVALFVTFLMAPFTAAHAQDASADTKFLVDNMNQMVGTLRENIQSLEQGMSDAETALDTAPEIVANLLEAVRSINEQIADDSETWTRLNGLVGRFDAERARTAKRANETGSDDLQMIAELWQKRLSEVDGLRDDIRRERARSLSLVNELEKKQEVVQELIKLDAAELVLKNLRSIRDNLVSVNNDMQAMLDKTKLIDDPSALQN